MSIKVFDFFSGCGGTSCGFAAAGLDIVFALDNDAVAIETFKENFPDVQVEISNIQNVEPEKLAFLIGERQHPLLFSGCAPCQPFSRQNRNKINNDPRRNLLSEFLRFVNYWLPEYVVVENVPGMQHLKSEGPFEDFVRSLNGLGYKVSYEVLPASIYGVPQRRKRLVLIASISTNVTLPSATHGVSVGVKCSTVRDWISDLPEIHNGETSVEDPDHQSARLSETNLIRIKATPEGGGRESWPKELWLDCHKRYSGHTDVYGRLHWDKSASGLTTRCISYSNGRFGHPIQNRAISIREAACLQTFPRSYRFKGTLQSKARQIGNAVPPLMAKNIAEAILEHHLSALA